MTTDPGDPNGTDALKELRGNVQRPNFDAIVKTIRDAYATENKKQTYLGNRGPEVDRALEGTFARAQEAFFGTNDSALDGAKYTHRFDLVNESSQPQIYTDVCKALGIEDRGVAVGSKRYTNAMVVESEDGYPPKTVTIIQQSPKQEHQFTDLRGDQWGLALVRRVIPPLEAGDPEDGKKPETKITNCLEFRLIPKGMN